MRTIILNSPPAIKGEEDERNGKIKEVGEWLSENTIMKAISSAFLVAIITFVAWFLTEDDFSKAIGATIASGIIVLILHHQTKPTSLKPFK